MISTHSFPSLLQVCKLKFSSGGMILGSKTFFFFAINYHREEHIRAMNKSCMHEKEVSSGSVCRSRILKSFLMHYTPVEDGERLYIHHAASGTTGTAAFIFSLWYQTDHFTCLMIFTTSGNPHPEISFENWGLILEQYLFISLYILSLHLACIMIRTQCC